MAQIKGSLKWTAKMEKERKYIAVGAAHLGEEREREIRPIRRRRRKERRDSETWGIRDPDPTLSAHTTQFRQFLHPFSGELSQKTTPNPHIDLPSSCFTPKIMKIGGGLMKPAPVGVRHSCLNFCLKFSHF